MDGAYKVKGSEVGIILEGPNKVTLEKALKLNFRASNNQAEYEALVTGLKLAREIEAKRLRCYTDSHLSKDRLPTHIRPRKQCCSSTIT